MIKNNIHDKKLCKKLKQSIEERFRAAVEGLRDGRSRSKEIGRKGRDNGKGNGMGRSMSVTWVGNKVAISKDRCENIRLEQLLLSY